MDHLVPPEEGCEVGSLNRASLSVRALEGDGARSGAHCIPETRNPLS